MSWQLPTLLQFGNQWEKEQEGGERAVRVLGWQRRGGCSGPPGNLAPDLFLLLICVPLSRARRPSGSVVTHQWAAPFIPPSSSPGVKVFRSLECLQTSGKPAGEMGSHSFSWDPVLSGLQSYTEGAGVIIQLHQNLPHLTAGDSPQVRITPHAWSLKATRGRRSPENHAGLERPGHRRAQPRDRSSGLGSRVLLQSFLR